MKKSFNLLLIAFALLILAACSGGSSAEGLDASSVSLDTKGLPYSWQANVIEATAYDDSQPN